MAQLGDFVRAKALLQSAARAFGPKEAAAARGVSFPTSCRCLSRVGHSREIIEISTA
jgi:hypothetical protein